MLSLSASNLLIFFSTEQKVDRFWYRECEGCYESSTDLTEHVPRKSRQVLELLIAPRGGCDLFRLTS